MIAEILKVELRESRVAEGRQFLAILINYDGDKVWTYCAPSAFNFFEDIRIFCNVDFIDSTYLINEQDFVHKLIPIKKTYERYMGKGLWRYQINVPRREMR